MGVRVWVPTWAGLLVYLCIMVNVQPVVGLLAYLKVVATPARLGLLAYLKWKVTPGPLGRAAGLPMVEGNPGPLRAAGYTHCATVAMVA